MTFLKQSLEIQREIGDKAGEGVTLNNISQIYDARGEYETALTFLKQSLEIQREIGDKAGMIPTLHNMATISLAKGAAQEFLQLEMEAWKLAHEVSYAIGIYHIGSYMGQVLVQNEMLEEALPFIQGAYQVAQQNQLPDEAQLAQLLQQIQSHLNP